MTSLPHVPGEWTDDELVARLREGGDARERAAMLLFARFAAVLAEEARYRGVRAPEDRELAGDVLTSAVEVLQRPATTTPASLPAYLVAAVRRRVLNRARGAQRAAAREALLVRELADAWPPASADDMPDEPPAAVPSPVAVLAAHLDTVLDDGDRQLLGWLGDHVPQRLMAEWLGVGHGAVRMRVSRLRQRLRALAHAFAAMRPPDERLAIERFLQRATRPAPTSTARPARKRLHGSSS